MNERDKWTDEEIRVLVTLYMDPEVPFDDVDKALPGRTPSAIYNKAWRMNLTRGKKVPRCMVCGNPIENLDDQKIHCHRECLSGFTNIQEVLEVIE